MDLTLKKFAGTLRLLTAVRPHLQKQTLRVMRLTAFILLVFCLHASARLASQTVTLTGKDVPVEKVFAEIKRQTGFLVLCNYDLLQRTRPVTINVANAPLRSVLDKVLAEQQLVYRIDERNIVVSRGEMKVGTDRLNWVVPVKGRVTDASGNPLMGVNISLKNSGVLGVSNHDGEFLFNVNAGDVLVITSAGFEAFEYKVPAGGNNNLAITLKIRITIIDSVEVLANTGYQLLKPNEITGSVVTINNALLNRTTSTNIIDRLRGVTSGLYSDMGYGGTTGNSLGISVRGLSTINSNTTPLIVIDNFPYDGDINTINPNDVENVTILKDAAAASIWGARSGNGVIVITTKKGGYNKRNAVSVTANTSISAKPDIFYSPQTSTSDYIDLELFLFSKGFYTPRLNSSQKIPVSPVVEILASLPGGVLTDAATAQINALRKNDIRNDVSKYLFQRAVYDQYNVNISGGGNNDRHYFSLGYDKNKANIKGDSYNRLSLTASNTYAFLNKKLEISTELFFTRQISDNNGTTNIANIYPYSRLADDNGKALSIPQYRQSFINTAGNGKLLDWNYRPLDELDLSDNRTTQNEYRGNLSIRYKLPAHFIAEVRYQYGKSQAENNNLQPVDAYKTRDYINHFTQINTTTGVVTNRVPVGGILDKTNTTNTYQNFRAQVSYQHEITKDQVISAIAGTEIRDAYSESGAYRLYGYNDDQGSYVLTDFVTRYPDFITGRTSAIKSGLGAGGGTNRYLSYYANASYSYKDKYALSASARSDGSNIFGVKTNQKRIPLWSVGGSWDITKERFYNLNPVPVLKLRGSYGYQGNVNSSVSAYLTIGTFNNNLLGNQSSVIGNYPNPDFRWERSSQFNVGIDFGLKNGILSGSIDYYLKKSVDLIESTPYAPSTGIIYFQGNVADMKGKGIDVKLNTTFPVSIFSVHSELLFNYNTNWLTAFYYTPGSNFGYVIGGLNPVLGKPLYALYSFPWKGLDAGGNPQSLLNGQVSTDYSAIGNINDASQLIYHGTRAPQYFGSFRNTIYYKNLSVSFNITYKLDYFFRRNTVNYNSLVSSSYSFGTGDYAKRWKKPGDEKITDVPSMIYPVSQVRDQVYGYSEATIEKGDLIRLQDIQLNYQWNRTITHRLPFSSIRVFATANNIGLLWTANKRGVDPEIATGGFSYLNPRVLTLGLNINL